MIHITVKDIIDNTDAKLLNGSLEQEIEECFIDSNLITNGSCFFGIRGENTDGSLYYKQALEKGAKVLVLSKLNIYDFNGFEDRTILISNDPKQVLQDLAKYKRSLFHGVVVAVTGSVGKTGTKEMISSVLQKRYKVLKTKKNNNSQLGLPLTMLRLKDEEVMVLEMGMSDLGHIHNLSLIAKPDIAVITNIYSSHIEFLKTKENILKAKLEIVDGMNNGILIVNNDNEYLRSINLENVNILTFGINNSSNVMPHDIINGFNTWFSIDDVDDLVVKGTYTFIYNALPAYLIGKLLGLSRGMIKDGINNVLQVKHRLNTLKLKDDIIVIDDTYNASYESVKVALEYLNTFNRRKIFVMGDILELGKESKSIHKKIGELVVKNNVDILITIGKNSKLIDKACRKNKFDKKYIKHFSNEKHSRQYISSLINSGDVVLVKGSNAMNLINIVEHLKKER